MEMSMAPRMEMRLKMAPQIIQSIEILQLPLLALLERIEQEQLENPLLEVEETAQIQHMPGSLEEAIVCLEADHDFLLKGDVFTDDAVHMWIQYKRECEVEPVRVRPHPHEFELYYDI